MTQAASEHQEKKNELMCPPEQSFVLSHVSLFGFPQSSLVLLPTRLRWWNNWLDVEILIRTEARSGGRRWNYGFRSWMTWMTRSRESFHLCKYIKAEHRAENEVHSFAALVLVLRSIQVGSHHHCLPGCCCAGLRSLSETALTVDGGWLGKITKV